jgi:hypothetical protein
MNTSARLLLPVLVLLAPGGLVPACRTQESGAPFPRDPESPRAAQVARATDVVQQWKAHQRLYVKGDVGLGPAQLDSLEQWLDTHAVNWAVVLVKNATGEQYTDPEGRGYSGVEAVNQALGRGLMNRTAFGQHTDPRTREADAAFMIVFLDEHKLSYAASEAQNKRQLGREQWVGNLDATAIAALRNGGRILDAVQGTVSKINGQMDARITGEIEARNRAAAAERAARAQAITQAGAALDGAASALTLLETETAKFTRGHQGMTGDLARPDVAALRAELQLAKVRLERGDPAKASASAAALRSRVDLHLQAVARYESDRAELDNLDHRLKAQATRNQAAAAGAPLRAGQEALARARTEHERGDSSYRAYLETAGQCAVAAENAITAAAKLAEQRRLLVGAGSASFLAALGIVGLVLNRRRLGVKTEAEQLFRTWERGLGEKNLALFELLDRRATVVGSAAEEARQRYSGDTLELSEHIIKDVDELFIMSSSTGRVLQDAQELLAPKTLPPRLANRFLRGRFRRALGLLRDHPIEFKPDSALELVVRGPRTERDRLLGQVASYQPFTMTFTELIEAFNQRAARALAALETVESSVISAGATLEQTQKHISAATALEPELERLAAEDGLFKVPALFGQLLPSAQKNLGEAIKTAVTDPVGSLRARGALARQQSDDAAALVDLLLEARKTAVPGLRASRQVLQEAELTVDWIEVELRQFSERCDAIVAAALTRSASQDIQGIGADLRKLAARAERAVELARLRREGARTQIKATGAEVEAARKDLSLALGKEPAALLREVGADPSELLAKAEEQWRVAGAALGRGEVEAAGQALKVLATLAQDAAGIVVASRQAFAEQEGTLAALREETTRIECELPAHEQVLEGIQTRHAPSVLLLRAGDAAHPDANGTVEDNLAEARAHLAAAKELAAGSVGAFRAGRVLEAADRLRQLRGRLESARYRLQEIQEKAASLAKAEAENARCLERLEGRQRECGGMVAARTTMAPTVRAFEGANALLAGARAAVQATVGDPFQAAADLEAAGKALEQVADKARCDRDVFEQAQRTVTAANAQLAEAQRLERAAATDPVGDSAAILEARAALQPLAAALRMAQDRLGAAHGDWHALDTEASRIATEAGRHAATLRGELERAQAALAALSAAATAVRLAGAWTGRYGVRIMGSPGSDVLARASGLLQAGQYEQALAQAAQARRLADLAVAEAEAEVRRRQFAEQQRLEAERQRRAAEEEARRSSWASSGAGSSTSGSSWGSTGSGVSTSSFSSDSGVATSSW